MCDKLENLDGGMPNDERRRAIHRTPIRSTDEPEIFLLRSWSENGAAHEAVHLQNARARPLMNFLSIIWANN